MMNKVIEILKYNNLKLNPCTIVEVQNLERKLNVNFPRSYGQFLLEFGKGAGNFMEGSQCFYDDLFNMQSGAVDLLRENHFKTLPEKAFIFWMHQGYQFAFFIANGADDPIIYYYNEGIKEQEFVKTKLTIEEFFYNELANCQLEIPSYLKK